MKDMQAVYDIETSLNHLCICEKGNLIKFMISLVYIELPLRFQRYSICHRSIEETNKLECALTFFINEVIILIFHLGLIPTLRIY